jgi:hypothetical protein
MMITYAVGGAAMYYFAIDNLKCVVSEHVVDPHARALIETDQVG